MIAASKPSGIRLHQDGGRTGFAFVVATITILMLVFSQAAYADNLFLFCSFLLGISCAAFIILYQPSKTLEPTKIFSLLYITSFSLAPIWLLDKRILTTTYFGNNYSEIMDRTALICLVAYLAFLAGFFIFKNNRSYKHTILALDYPTRSIAITGAIATLIPAIVCYLLLIAQVGGIGWLLGYSGGRADLLSGVYGGLFWGIHLLFAAYGFYLIANIQRHPWFCLVIGIGVSLMFVPFHGRDLIIAPIFCWMLMFHLLRKNISWKMVLIGAACIITISGLVAAFRSGGNLLAMKDAMAFFSQFFASFTLYFSGVVEVNIEQFDSAMIAVRFVEKEQYVLGPMVLLSWMEPIDRAVLGNIIPSIHSGIFLDLLVMPEHKGWNTAVSPSLVGELWLSLGWLGVTIGMAVIGAAFAWLSRWSNTWYKQPVMAAAYPFTVYMMTKMVVDGTVHLFRPLLIIGAVWVFWYLFGKSRTMIAISRHNTA